MYLNEPQRPFTDRLIQPNESTELPKGPIDSSERHTKIKLRAEKRVARKAAKRANEVAVAEKEKQRKAKSPLFYCPTDGCGKTYTHERGLSNHIATGKHVIRSNKSLQTSVGDYLRKTRLHTLVPASAQVLMTESSPVSISWTSLSCCRNPPPIKFLPNTNENVFARRLLILILVL